MKKAVIIKCRNPFLWYADELRKEPAERKRFNFIAAPDNKGIIMRKGYVYKGDYKVVKC